MIHSHILKSLIDRCVACLLLLLLLPLFLVVAIVLKFKKQDVFFLQERVGQHLGSIWIYKFTTMPKGSDKLGHITTAGDPRVFGFGKLLRRYKINELPQLINVLKGEMSLVGPRPLLREHAELYPPDARQRIYSFKPGLTGYGSLEFSQEDHLLADVEDFEKHYAEVVMPKKAALELSYIDEWNILLDLRVLAQTFTSLLTGWLRKR